MGSHPPPHKGGGEDGADRGSSELWVSKLSGRGTALGQGGERQLPAEARVEDGQPWNGGGDEQTETKADEPATAAVKTLSMALLQLSDIVESPASDIAMPSLSASATQPRLASRTAFTVKMASVTVPIEGDGLLSGGSWYGERLPSLWTKQLLSSDILVVQWCAEGDGDDGGGGGGGDGGDGIVVMVFGFFFFGGVPVVATGQRYQKMA